jgi:hypothetical protein
MPPCRSMVDSLHRQTRNADSADSLPTLKHDLNAVPYITEQNGIAHIDEARLLGSQQRMLAESLHVPHVVQKSQSTVSASILTGSSRHRRKLHHIMS